MAAADRDTGFLDEQDPQVRRRIRQEYRALIEHTQKNREEMIDPGSTKLQVALEKSSQCFQNVKQTREAAMDSTLMSILASFGQQQAQSVHTDTNHISPTEFTLRLVNHLNERSLTSGEVSEQGWEKLGASVQRFFKKSPPLHLLYGTLEHEAPVKPVREKRAKNPEDKRKAPATAPKQLKDFSESQRQETTTAEVEKLLGILQRQYRKCGNEPICLMDFVVNPFSFNQTIENLFYTSFLVKDNHARIFLDDLKLPVIEPIKSVTGQSAASLPCKQVVMTLTKAEWRDVVQAFDIKNPLIPHRREETNEDKDENNTHNNNNHRQPQMKNTMR